MRKELSGVSDHSKTTPHWHNLQDCAICLKIFLPQRYEERLQHVEAERDRIRKAAIPKTYKRGPGLQFSKEQS